LPSSSQEGSTIETAVEIVRGDERSECKPGRAQPSRVVPEPSSLGMHPETFRLRNHPSRHRKERDDAALTQEGHLHAFTVSIILCAELIGTEYSLNSRFIPLPPLCSNLWPDNRGPLNRSVS
jgi:hypothetical protein